MKSREGAVTPNFTTTCTELTRSNVTDPVATLRQRMEEMQGKEGEAYPPCVVPIPYYLTGRGFFPGGDGIWRDSHQISQPASVAFPTDGIMVLGQDFGSLKEYPAQSRSYELDSLLTWKYLVPRLRDAHVPFDRVFFSNGLLGLRRVGSNDGRHPGLSIPTYVQMCSEFLRFQIAVQNPRLIVIFDSLDESVYLPFFAAAFQHPTNVRIFRGEVLGRNRVMVKTQHPRSDCGVINRNKDNYRERCRTIEQAWQLSVALD